MKETHIGIIGSCVCDVILTLPKLPTTAQDVHLYTQTMRLGGCAYNAAQVLQVLQQPYVLFSPVGKGIYGDYVRTHLHDNHMHSIIEDVEDENGCCYCLVEDSGERTFLSLHGCEYRFQKAWFTRLNAYTFDSVYICGLEIEEDSGRYILEWLQQHPEVTIYFAPGPRICKIPSERMQALLRMHAILHINEEEALSYTHSTSIQQAATMLYAQSHAPIIITLGANGVYFYDGMQAFTIPSPSVQVKDTIGAGDTHIGALLALRHMKKDWPTALFYANQLAAKVVSHVGADLRKEDVIDLFPHIKSLRNCWKP